MTDTEQRHTPGPIRISERAGNYDSRVNSYALTHGRVGNYLAIVEACGNAALSNQANARLLAASYNAFDSAATRLDLNAVDLAERMQDGGIADLVEALGRAADYCPLVIRDECKAALAKAGVRI